MNALKPRSIIIDTDPGIDDAIALLVAMMSPELNILGITTVAGNVTQDVAFKNAHKLKQLAKASTTIYKGCEAPMVVSYEKVDNIYGEMGLGYYDQEVVVPDNTLHAVDFIIEQCRTHHDSPITICTLGPLTNLAMALIKSPDIKEGIECVVMMAGALEVAGNILGAAEFNVYVDPHAAKVVLASGVPIVMLPLDVANKTSAPEHWVEGFQQHPSAGSQAIYKMLSFCKKTDNARMYDACVIAWLLEPEIFRTRPCAVNVDADSLLSRGNTLANFAPEGDLFIKAAYSVNSVALYALLTERLNRLNLL